MAKLKRNERLAFIFGIGVSLGSATMTVASSFVDKVRSDSHSNAIAYEQFAKKK